MHVSVAFTPHTTQSGRALRGLEGGGAGVGDGVVDWVEDGEGEGGGAEEEELADALFFVFLLMSWKESS